MRGAAEPVGAAEADGVRRQFEEAVGRVSKWSGPAIQSNDQLVLYGLYKQASFGDCRSQRPGLFDPTGRAKWTSWKSYEGLGDFEAMQRYCRVAAAVCPGATAAGCGEDYRGLAEARTAIETNGHVDGDLNGNSGPARASLSTHDDEAHGDDDGGRVQQESRTTGASMAPPPSRDSFGSASVAATGGTREPQSTGRLRRRLGKGEDRLAAPVNGCSPGPSPSGPVASAHGDDGFGGLQVAGVAAVTAVVMLSTAVALGGGGHDVREEGAQETVGGRGDGVYEGTGDVWRLVRAWPGATALLLLLSASAVVAAGCLWCAIRVARWREEIFAGSPMVAEVLARAAALDGDRSQEDHSSPCAEPWRYAGSNGSGGSSSSSSGCSLVTSSCGGDSGADDPVGNIFRAGTRASRDFYAPCVVTKTASAGGDRSRGTAVSKTAAATAARAVDDAHGAVVFLTGVTGLVGQMVLFDLLKQGAAAARLASAGDDGDDAKNAFWEASLSPRALRRVVVLVRGKKGVGPLDRLASIRDSPMFRPLRESGVWVDDGDASGLGPRRESGRGVGTVVTAVEGELGKEGLGLTAEARALLGGVGVTHALHCAASVSFSDPLAEAAATNVTGALRVAALVASWPSCGTLVHVSTAFVHGGNSGTTSSPLPQKLPDLGGRNPERLYRSAQHSTVVGVGGDIVQSAKGPGREAVEAMADLSYPNTYTFTKALGEHLLARALDAHNRKLDRSAVEEGSGGDGRASGAGGEEASGRGVSPGPRRLRLRVVRPSVVGPSWVFPWPGWTGEQPSTVTGCLVLLLQRAVKTFRLRPHVAPVIPVDVVSRAIVHSALGWGGALTTAAATSRVAAVDSIPRRRPRNHSCTDGAGSGSAASSCPEVMIRNLAWATHPIHGGGGGAAAPQKKGDTGDGDIVPSGAGEELIAVESSGNGTAVNRNPPRLPRLETCNDAAWDGGEGRMPSFREFSALLFEYAVLRGLRPSFEALAMTSSLAAASVLPESLPAMWPEVRARNGLLSPPGGHGEELPHETNKPEHGPLGLRASSRLVFDAMHLLLDRSPVWALQGALNLATWVGRLGGFGGGNRGGGGDGSTKGGGRAGATATLRRLDKLAALPAVYEAFTWQQYYFDSALRVPGDLTPEGYALETALASELLQQSLPGGPAVGAKASPERRCAILRELGMQIRTHRSGGLRCRGSSGRIITSVGGDGGIDCVRDGADSVERRGSANGGDDVVAEPRDEERSQRDRSGGPLSLLCGRADRLVPWPALAWWAATLPGSAARGGVTVWVRLVAFAVRVVMSRAASAVAVDVHSFRAAAPPGHRAGVAGGVGVGRGRPRQTAGAARGLRRGEELKEDGATLFRDVGAGRADSGEDLASRARDHQEEGGGVVGGGGAAVAGAAGERSWRTTGRERAVRDKGEEDAESGGGGAAEGGAAGKVVVVLLPTHRSYLDFVLVSLFCASMRSFPGLSWLRVPKVAAADGPFGKEGTPLRWLMEKLGAFFVRRGNKGEPHSALQRRLEALQEDNHEGREGDEASQNRSEEEVDGVTPSSTSVARKLEGHGSSGDAARRTPISGEEQVKTGECSRDGRPGAGAASRGGWPGPCESDPWQRGLETLEVFVEGSRSRDRRFLAPKTGLIRALQGAREGATLWLVPVSISYERVPEQARLAEELLASRDDEGSQGHQRRQQQQQPKGPVGLTGLLRWTLKALSGRVRLGRVLMRAEDPVVLRPGGDVRAALLEVRRRHRLGTVVTPYHIREAAEHLGLGMEDVRECVQELGGTVWDEDDDEESPFARRWGSLDLEKSTKMARPLRYASDILSAERRVSAAEPASNDTEAWMNHLQWLHLLEGRLRGESGGGDSGQQLARWADWLVPPPRLASGSSTASGTGDEREEGRDGGSDAREDLRFLQAEDIGASDGSVGTSIAGDTACGTGVYVDIPDREDFSATTAAADTRETADTAMNSPRSAESSSSSSTPSWVMANGSSTDSSSASSAPSSFEATPLLEEDSKAAAAPSTATITAPPLSAPPLPNDAAASVASASSTSNGDGRDGTTTLGNTAGHGDEASRQKHASSSALHRVLAAIMRELDLAEEAVAQARQSLLDKGFSQPTRGHVLQFIFRNAAEENGSWDRAEGPGETSNDVGRSRVRSCDGTARIPSMFLASVALSLTSDASSLGETNASQKLADSASIAAVANAASQPGSGDDADEEGSWFGAVDGDKEAVGSWGFRDSGFCLESDRPDGGDPYVVMRGNRYGVCGRPLRGLLPFVREAVAVPISADGRARRAASPPPPPLPPSRLLLVPRSASLDAGCRASSGDCSGVTSDAIPNAPSPGQAPVGGEDGRQTRTLLASMVEAMGPGFDCQEQVSFSRQERARHGAGHALSDIWSLRSGQLRRAPDAVVWPTSEDQVSRLMEWAGQKGICLIPFGGGTSVTRALEVPPFEVEPRPVVSVDMRKMCRVLEVDVANGTAHIQAGVVGRTMANELAERGVTMGHEPDSLEFSTLGGWVATRASGMKRGRYGNIEDMVLEVRVVTGRGLAWQHSDRAVNRPKAAGAFSRTSVGLDLAAAMLGSEGCLGIITSVVVKVVPLPAVSEHASFLFKDFPTGVAFCRELSRSSSRLGLASCRLLDNRQLRLGKAMKGEEEGATSGFRATLKALAPKAQSAYIRIWKGWEWTETSAVTMVFEGSRQEVDLQRSEVSRIARSHGGLSGGASAGKSGYDLTFAIAYLRDFALLFDVLGESFETFVSWTALEGLCERVRERVRREHRRRGLRGDAFVTHRVTQLYPEGACVYFYLAIYAQGVRNPTGVFAELEEAARDEILLAGGSLSHHHGIGKSRAGFLSRVSSPVVSDLVLGMKRALDPHNVLGARNHLVAAGDSSAHGGRVGEV